MLCGRRCSASQLVSSRLLIFHHPPEIQGYAAPALHSHTRVTAASRTRTCAQPCHRLRLHDSTHLWSQSPQAARMTRNRRGRSLSISGSIRRGGSSKSYSQLSRTEQSKMCKREMEWSKVSKVTSHTVAAVVVVTHIPLPSPSTGTGIRPALHAVWWGSHHTSHSPPLPLAGSRSRPTPKTCRPADGRRPAKRPGAHAARRIAHTPSERLDSPAARLATRRVKLLQSLWRTGERAARRFRSLLLTTKRDQCVLHDDSVLCLSYFAMSKID
jgi:hypothetical protein